MIVKMLIVGPIMANCYIVGCNRTNEAVVIDPGDEGERILSVVADESLTVKYILNTHGHFDHVGANREIKEKTGADLMIHAEDAPMLQQLSSSAAAWGFHAVDSPPPDRKIKEGDEITFGEITMKVLHTPGHTPGGVAFYTDGCVFVGDTLFMGSIGRTDFPGGDYDTLIQSVKTRLFTLPEETKVYPGHNHETTIGREKGSNPFFR